MKKIYIVITFIICLFLLGCSNEKRTVYNEKEILDFVYSGYLDVDRPEYDEKYKDYLYYLNIRNTLYTTLDLLTINRNHDSKIYEADIYKKKYVAGYISNETINKMVSLYDGSYEYIMNEEKGYSSLYPIYSKLYQEGSLSLEKDKTYIYSFNDGIPLEYNDKKLVFVIEYYEISLNDDKIITPIIYTKGRMIDNCYYCDISIIYLHYGLYIYQELNDKKVMALPDFYTSCVESCNDTYITWNEQLFIYNGTVTEEEFILLSEEEQELYLECFEELKSALVENTSHSYRHDASYCYDYLKLKEILITD